MYFLLKTLISAITIAAISEVARRSSVFAAAVASLPLTSILAMVWLYSDTHDTAKISALSHNILWLILPSLLFFFALPQLLRFGLAFYPALATSIALMVAGYAVMLAIKALFAPA